VSELVAFQDRLGHRFRDEKLLRLALTHPSIGHEQNQPLPNNQRLEFLGDAVLGLILSHELFEKFADADEGSLTKSRAKLVNSITLAEHGRKLGLGPLLILSKGEEVSGGRDRPSALADAFEAVLGAIFLDSGFTVVREVVLREFEEDFGLLASPAGIENPKGELQELLQTRSPNAPEYRTISAAGPDHDRDFECAVFHDGVELARGCGKSKKSAETNAAVAALKILVQQAAS
jgi:ribonuclease-3